MLQENSHTLSTHVIFFQDHFFHLCGYLCVRNWVVCFFFFSKNDWDPSLSFCQKKTRHPLFRGGVGAQEAFLHCSCLSTGFSWVRFGFHQI